MEEAIAIILILEALGIAKIHGKGLIKAAARAYVSLAQKTEETMEPIRETWQSAVVEAREECARRVAQEQGRTTQGVRAQEKRGETKIKKGTKATAEAAAVAGEAATAA
jgi:hypothetical protein